MLLLSSCATLFTKSNQEITFKGVPGTSVIDKKKNKVIAEVGSNGFATANVRKQLSSKRLEATKDGYRPREFTLNTKLEGWVFGNILFGGIPGLAIDAATGKMMKYSNTMLDVTLTSFEKPTQEVEEEEVTTNVVPSRVSRNNPGATDMEKTILRWYIDSDPRGARVFWRVISNVPGEVHNTNESYMTTTPIEETKSFNIPGLTYDNANNVTIEIKVTKRGYEDQVKRYNARQAIDQQEISGFFELVEK